MAAGGMGGARRGLSLERRVRVGGREPGSGWEDCPARHCWVAGAADDDGTKRPGLLVEWRESAAGWEGRVVYVARLRPDTWSVVEEWLPSSLLTPR